MRAGVVRRGSQADVELAINFGGLTPSTAELAEAVRIRFQRAFSYSDLESAGIRLELCVACEALDLGGAILAPSLPSKLGVFALTTLRTLALQKNQLTEIPHEIGSLTRLRMLYLDHNNLTTLPPSIGDLHALRTLRLHGNRLKTLPSSIAALTALQQLHLHRNCFL